MNLGEILDEVKILIDDDSFSDSTIIDYINNTIKWIGDEVNLPSLKGIDTVETVVSQNYALLTGLTDGFSGRLVSCLSEDIIVYSSLEALMEDFISDIDMEGAVEGVALEGTILWYQKIPAAAETLTLIYYKNPTTLTAMSHTPPVDIHESLHRRLFVNGTAFFLYDLKEDGVEGEKVNANSQYYQAFEHRNKQSGMTLLKASLARKKVHRISSVWNY